MRKYKNKVKHSESQGVYVGGSIMVYIDKEQCVGCNACVKDCPGNALVLAEGKAEVRKACIQCGHCVAVCPVKAVAIPEYDMKDVEEFEHDSFTIPSQNFLHAVKFRRSIRNFKSEKIDGEKACRVLDAGRYTATAKNEQACTFIFIQDRLEEFKALVWQEMPAILESLKETAPDYAKAFTFFYRKWKEDSEQDTFFFNTPAFLVIASQNPLDGGLAAANIENMAVAEGLGALYSGYMMRVISSSPVLREWLGVAEKRISCCMLLGYPAVSYKRTAPRRTGDIVWK